MPETLPDTQPLSAFHENPTEVIERLKSTRRPITLTVDGKPEIVIQEAAAYQRLLDLAVEADEDLAIQLGLEDMYAGRTRPLDEVFDEMRETFAIPR